MKQLDNEIECYKSFVDNSIMLVLDCSDFFESGSGCSFNIAPEDFSWIKEIYKIHGSETMSAVCAYLCNTIPIDIWRTEGFKKAYEAIKQLNPKVYSEQY